MFYITFAAIFALIILGAVSVGVFASDPEDKKFGFAAAGVVALILAIFTLVFSFTTVSARTVGVETAFGRYQGTLEPGPHLIAPWSSVEEFSTRVQFLDLDSRNGGSNIRVKYEGGGGGNVDAVVRWRIEPSDAKSLWEKYKTFDNVRDQLVDSSSQDSYRVIIGSYSPTEAIAGSNVRPISEGVLSDLNNTLNDDGIFLDSVSTKNVSLDKDVQRTLDRQVIAAGLVEVAEREQERARIDAETAAIREKGGSLTPAALQRYCYEVTNAWDVKKNGPLPATWNCASGGAQAPVIVGR